MRSHQHRMSNLVSWAVAAASLAAAPAMATSPSLDDWAAQLGIPPEVAAVAKYTHLAPGDGAGGRGVVGPDVIVSQIGSTFSKYGTVGGISGYAFTTVSCNIGDEWAEWFANTNRHPLIGQNLYRYKTVDGAGRFEQIGQAWLKHGWCAADAGGSGCGSCPAPGSGCDWLGINCSDTYGASLNGVQSDLGPKSEVNASTAAYPYPYVRAWNQSGDAIFKRLQVANADLDPAQNAGAQYFGESQYLCTDEAPHGTQFNNCSWRSAVVGSFSGGGWNMGFSGTTIQQQQAIRAWKNIDPAVTILDAHVPGDGMFTVGYRVTDLGDGTWHYEYAIHNYNSDRSAGSLAVPVPAGVQITGAGFHDVDYHSGEPFSGVDWAATRSADALTWATQTYGENQNANALRWSTMYNFRFVADQPPTTGDIQIGLFKPGTGDSVSFSGPVPTAPAAGCPGDFNGDGALDVSDFSDFRAAYLAGNMDADYSGNGSLGVEDFTAFRAAYLAGCP